MFNESDGFQEVCVQEFNPLPGEHHILLAYKTITGTASGEHCTATYVRTYAGTLVLAMMAAICYR